MSTKKQQVFQQRSCDKLAEALRVADHLQSIAEGGLDLGPVDWAVLKCKIEDLASHEESLRDDAEQAQESDPTSDAFKAGMAAMEYAIWEGKEPCPCRKQAAKAVPAGFKLVLIKGAVFEDGGVSLIQRGSEDVRVAARPGCERIYRLAPAPEVPTYEQLEQALHDIDTWAAMLPTFEVVSEGGFEAFVSNIIRAIKLAAAPAPEDEPVFHLRSYGDVSASFLEAYAVKHSPPAPEAQAVPAVLKLSDGGKLVREGPHWSLRRDGNHIRYLNRFETEFIRAAQAAGQDEREAFEKCAEEIEQLQGAWITTVAASRIVRKHAALAQRQSLTEAAADVLAERQRQISAEGWTPKHDDAHPRGELSQAAACYATWAFEAQAHMPNWVPTDWPWDDDWWKVGEPRRMLVKAAALLLAEIERLDRAGATTGEQQR